MTDNHVMGVDELLKAENDNVWNVLKHVLCEEIGLCKK